MLVAIIVPFKGLRYNEEIVGNLAEVIVPPYDMITAGEQEELYRRSPYNLVRLEYGKSSARNRAGENRYTRAAADLEAWLQDKVLLPEKERSFYIYRQSFTVQGVTFHRTGLIAALGLEPYSSKVILPHEETLASPKKDRLSLLRSCRANFSPIFGLFTDQKREFASLCSPLQQKAPLFEFTDRQGETHALWGVEAPEERAALVKLIAPRQIFIADGHHRYDTALQYSREAAAGGEPPPGSGYVLAVLVPLDDPGLVILPFHRILKNMPVGQLELLTANVERHFEVEDRGPLKELKTARLTAEINARGKDAPAMGLLLSGRVLLLTLKGKKDPGDLDVSLLKNLLLDPLFAGGAAAEGHLDFTIDGDEARSAVMVGEAQAAFLLNPTPIAEVTARALKGENMPQKSTCFYPKLPGGLVIHHLDLGHLESPAR